MSLRDRLNAISVSGDLFPNLTKGEKIADRLIAQIAREIRNQRDSMGMTQQQFAKSVNVGQSMVCKWESGDCNFSIESIAKIFAQLGRDVELNFPLTGSKLDRGEWVARKLTKTKQAEYSHTIIELSKAG